MDNLSILGALLELLLHPWGHFGSTLDPFLVFRNALGCQSCFRSPPKRSPPKFPHLFGAILSQFFDIFGENESLGESCFKNCFAALFFYDFWYFFGVRNFKKIPKTMEGCSKSRILKKCKKHFQGQG